MNLALHLRSRCNLTSNLKYASVSFSPSPPTNTSVFPSSRHPINYQKMSREEATGNEITVYEDLPDLWERFDMLSSKKNIDKLPIKQKLKSMARLVEQLPSCDTIEKIDDLSVQACALVRKGSPKDTNLLFKSLFTSPNPRLLIYYARFIATLGKIWAHFGSPLAQGLVEGAMTYINESKLDWTEERKTDFLSVLKLLCELWKFNVIDLHIVLPVYKELKLHQDRNAETFMHLKDAYGDLFTRCEEEIAGKEARIAANEAKKAEQEANKKLKNKRKYEKKKARREDENEPRTLSAADGIGQIGDATWKASR